MVIIQNFLKSIEVLFRGLIKQLSKNELELLRRNEHLHLKLHLFPLRCSKKLHLQSYLEMLWSETGYFGLLGNNFILFIILLYLIER